MERALMSGHSGVNSCIVHIMIVGGRESGTDTSKVRPLILIQQGMF